MARKQYIDFVPRTAQPVQPVVGARASAFRRMVRLLPFILAACIAIALAGYVLFV